jgi:(S)-mandelate dehydrogenase
MLNDRGLASALLDKVYAAGFEVLQLTVDTAVSGRRNRDIRNGFTLPFRWTLSNLFDTARHPRWALGMLAAGTPNVEAVCAGCGCCAQGSDDHRGDAAPDQQQLHLA